MLFLAISVLHNFSFRTARSPMQKAHIGTKPETPHCYASTQHERAKTGALASTK
jgi:hypothetical protein